jgi:lysozyme family protein
MTKFGIDARSHPGVDIAALTAESARAIYEAEWKVSPANSLPDDLGFVYFDTRINCGSRPAWRWLERHLDCAAYLNARDEYYWQLADDHPKLRKFLHGWLNRTKALRREVNL